LAKGLTPLGHRTLVRAHPISRLGDAAEVVAFLLSDHASFITGSYHLVDGGYAAH
jgi:NAD(P)-dependent dehydrogenase (short-subunit alcohol dehydrogenase family)